MTDETNNVDVTLLFDKATGNVEPWSLVKNLALIAYGANAEDKELALVVTRLNIAYLMQKITDFQDTLEDKSDSG